MDELRDLVALSVQAGSRVLAVAPDRSLLERLAGRNCRTWSAVADDRQDFPIRAMCEGVVVGDLDQLDLADAFPSVDFDAVVLMGALAHVISPSELLRGTTKVLAASGQVVASVPNATHASRRLRFWQGLGQEEEAGPGRSLLRTFNASRIEELMSDNGLSTVETLRVRRPPADPVPDPSLPVAVLDFLAADDDALVDHYVIIASPAAGQSAPPPSLAEELQRRLHRAEDRLAERASDLETLEHELETLQLDLALKDDFALELTGKVRTADAMAAGAGSELARARASLERAEHQLLEQEREMEELRRLAGRGVRSLILDRLTAPFADRRRGAPGSTTPPT